MKLLTAKELIESLEFSHDDISITHGHPHFDSNLKTWLSNMVEEDWDNDNVIMLDRSSGEDPWKMTREEYVKL